MATQARRSELDQMVDSNPASVMLADELFAIVELLETESGLRNALSDPSAAVDSRRQLAADIAGRQVSALANAILREAVGLRWESGFALVDALERQGERILLRSAQARDALATVRSELFDFSRIITGTDVLRQAVGDWRIAAVHRAALVEDLLANKVDAVTLLLANRAVAERRGTFETSLDEILGLAAEVQQHAVAQVRVAIPLDDAQIERLKTALAALVGRPITLEIVVDPLVLGGASILIGDDLIDGTIIRRLDTAKKQLT